MPGEYIKAFEPMCMAAPRTKYEDVESIIKEELGKGIDEMFSEFSKEPLASASLG